MKKEKLLMILAVWIIVFPNLGFPPSWRKILLLITGLCVGFIAYSIRNNRIKNELAAIVPEVTTEEYHEEIIEETI
ncbi:MAG: hypothetical protein WCO58_01135 [bacterium]